MKRKFIQIVFIFGLIDYIYGQNVPLDILNLNPKVIYDVGNERINFNEEDIEPNIWIVFQDQDHFTCLRLIDIPDIEHSTGSIAIECIIIDGDNLQRGNLLTYLPEKGIVKSIDKNNETAPYIELIDADKNTYRIDLFDRNNRGTIHQDLVQAINYIKLVDKSKKYSRYYDEFFDVRLLNLFF
jgi:hypothetical protein